MTVRKELLRLNNLPNFVDDYANGVASFKRCGIFDVLRLLGQPQIPFDGKDVQALATQAARSAGWNAAINILLSFEQLIDEAVTPVTSPQMRYGGLEAAVKSGDILKEEADAIRRGQPITAAIYSKPKPAGQS